MMKFKKLDVYLIIVLVTYLFFLWMTSPATQVVHSSTPARNSSWYANTYIDRSVPLKSDSKLKWWWFACMDPYNLFLREMDPYNQDRYVHAFISPLDDRCNSSTTTAHWMIRSCHNILFLFTLINNASTCMDGPAARAFPLTRLSLRFD
jgi:hypothetical protein